MNSARLVWPTDSYHDHPTTFIDTVSKQKTNLASRKLQSKVHQISNRPIGKSILDNGRLR